MFVVVVGWELKRVEIMITDRHLIILAFIILIMLSFVNNSQDDKIKYLENENEKIRSNLGIMNYALEKNGLILYKIKEVQK